MIASATCDVWIGAAHHDQLLGHLFPGDRDEHGAVLHAGVVRDGDVLRFVVRHIELALPGRDYVKGKIGYRALHPTFIHRQIIQCRNEKLAYLAVHNHDCGDRVAFSTIDLDSHERGYPALLDIGKGIPVGALVFGRDSAQADVWLPGRARCTLGELRVIGQTIRRFYPAPRQTGYADVAFDRQVRMFGVAGQTMLKASKVAVVGLGGVGSLVSEYLARLGVGELILIDPDHIEETNLSRVVGATQRDVRDGLTKTQIAARHAREAAPGISLTEIDGDVARRSVAMQLRSCDYIFLAADSMRARLIVNALAHQYLIPVVQLGAKIRSAANGCLDESMSVVRQVRPGEGCLWCNGFIDTGQLAVEAKTDQERKDQAYGTNEANPSVITLNAVAAAHAVNDFLFDFLALRRPANTPPYTHFHFLKRLIKAVLPRREPQCRECVRRYGMGDAMQLPGFDG
ncbi:ThiF family adenylyltransferase [Novosphingobium sp. Gsoil 351]|uniref:ThiF family adenylyltransferase n=1 Tax=Novosphingobium sp. Gsoil 351 TaxID=2675225 RepID=UPI0012B4E789|nr:ThiF family adenylyltransferase [Novosphingobium sp. Gsoil 351]QGN54076.1 ThiF family adenylyltransferase [Novosphingobium sp. Gsoil 351]